MAINLSRNTRLVVTTLDDTSADTYTNLTPSNAFEVAVLDGYSFSQAADSVNITLNEAGDSPVRGQKIFNTALNPADFSFTTYIRPFIDSNDSNNHNCIERVLWEALVGEGNQSTLSTAPFLNTSLSTSAFKADFENSNVHELLKLQLFFIVDNTVYKLADAAINTAEIDFSIDAIAQITWSGFAKGISEYTAGSFALSDAGTRYKGIPSTAPDFIKNKLSTLVLRDNLSGGSAYAQWTVYYSTAGNGLKGTDTDAYAAATTYDATITVDGGTPQTISYNTTTHGTGNTINYVIDQINEQLDGANVTLDENGDILITSMTAGASSSISVTDGVTNALFGAMHAEFDSIGSETTAGAGTPTTYNIPITGGTLTIDNGITYLTPEELAKVNKPIGSFTGARNISGSITAYLKTGTTDTGGLLNKLATDTNTVTQDFDMEVTAGGSSNTPRAKFTLPHAHLVIPSVDVQDVVSTTVEFTALGQDITVADEMLIEYVAATTVAY